MLELDVESRRYGGIFGVFVVLDEHRIGEAWMNKKIE